MQRPDENALADFVARHARVYEPDSDTYDRPAFAADIKEGKNDPIYNAHSYHTKVPPRAIIPYILHYTEPGDLILDPFCGSGMTGVAALMCANPPRDLLEQFPDLRDRVGPRRAILNDLSPAACHIARNYCTPVDVDALRREFDRIKAAVKEEFDWLYGTEHYEPAIGIYAATQPKVLARLKQTPDGAEGEARGQELWQTEKTWELVDRSEVERRLGYPVRRMSFKHRRDLPGDFDASTQENWLVIPATIQYTIWSDVYRCDGMITLEEPTGRISSRGKNAGKPIVRKKRVKRGCGEEIVLWDVAVNEETKETSASFRCTNCNQAWEKADLDFVRAVSVYLALDFEDRRGKWKRVYRHVSAQDVAKTTSIEAAPIPVWFPNSEIYPYRELMSMGVTKHGVSRISDFYTRRNIRALARFWCEVDAVTSPSIKSHARYVLTSTFGSIERTTRYRFGRGGNDSLSGLLYIGSYTVENNFLSQLNTKLLQVIEGLALLFAKGDGAYPALHVRKGSADDLGPIPDESIDYIFTDPPFGGNIFYSDASMLYEAWLQETTDERQEFVYHRRSRQQRERDGFVFKTINDYATGMARAFSEAFRVLKPGRWATVEFNNSDGQVFEAIKTAVRDAGFEIQNMMFLDKEQKTFKQIKGVKGEEDVVGHDVIFNLQKPHADTRRSEVRKPGDDLVAVVVETVGEHLRTLPERMRQDGKTYTDDHRTTPFLNTMLMNALIPRGVDVSQLNLPFIDRVCGRYFRNVEGRWYLRSEAVGAGNGNAFFQEIDVKDESSAIAWLRHQVRQRPLLLGEVRPLWMRAIALLPNEVSQRLDLEKLLSENFYRDPESNRWREPTEEERQRMNDDRVLRVMHDAERHLSRTLRREPGDEEVCDWIDTLFRACKAVEDQDRESLPALRGFTASEGYRLICGLFANVLRDRVPPPVYARASKQADAASRRFQKCQAAAQPTEKKGTRTDQPGLFDDR